MHKQMLSFYALLLTSLPLVSNATCENQHIINSSESTITINFDNASSSGGNGNVWFHSESNLCENVKNGPCVIPAKKSVEIDYTTYKTRIDGVLQISDNNGHKYNLGYANFIHYGKIYVGCPEYPQNLYSGYKTDRGNVTIESWPFN